MLQRLLASSLKGRDDNPSGTNQNSLDSYEPQYVTRSRSKSSPVAASSSQHLLSRSPSSTSLSNNTAINNSNNNNNNNNSRNNGVNKRRGSSPRPWSPASSTSSSVNHISTKLTSLLEQLQSTPRLNFQSRCDLLSSIQSCLMSPQDKAAFGDSGGFLVCISILSSLEDPSQSRTDNSRTATPNTDSNDKNKEEEEDGEENDVKKGITVLSEYRLKLVNLVLQVLDFSLRNHDNNKCAFEASVGYRSIIDAMKLSNLLANPNERHLVLSLLISFMVDDFSDKTRHFLNSIFQNTSFRSDKDIDKESLAALSRLRIHHPGIAPVLLQVAQEEDFETDIRSNIITILFKLSQACQINSFHIAHSGTTQFILKLLLDSEKFALSKNLYSLYLTWLESLLEYGLSSSEAQTLLGSLINSSQQINNDLLRLVYAVLVQPVTPEYIHFEQQQRGSCHQSSYIHLKSLRRQFPPSSGSGYTFMMWFCIDNVEPSSLSNDNSELILMTLSDASKQCFVQLSLNTSSYTLLFRSNSSQTSNPVKLDKFIFKSHKWYHLAITQIRPHFSNTSPVTLYVDGTEVAVEKATWPADPASGFPVEFVLGYQHNEQASLASSTKSKLSNNNKNLENDTNSTMGWNCGPCWFWEGDLSSDIIYLCSQLGPKYTGLFQDSLINHLRHSNIPLTNVTLARFLESSKQVSLTSFVTLLQNTSSGHPLIDRSKLYCAFFASNANNVYNSSSNTSSVRNTGISEVDLSFLENAVTSNHPIIFNSDTSTINTALSLPWGKGIISGSPPVIGTTSTLEHYIYSLGGVSFALKLIELSNSSSQLFYSVQIFIKLIEGNYKAAIEANNIQAYEILGILLRRKANDIDMRTFYLLIQFSGLKNSSSQNPSILKITPVARFILLDFQIWSKTRDEIQVELYSELTKLYTANNTLSKLNCRKLSKLKACTKFLSVLRIDTLSQDVLDTYLTTMKAMVIRSFSEVIRPFAIFLATDIANKLDRPKSQIRTYQSIRAFETLIDVLLEPENDAFLEKFSTAVTIRWIFLFLNPESPRKVVIAAFRLLIRLLSTRGQSFINRFQNMFDGFRMLKTLLVNFWDIQDIYFQLLSLFFGVESCTPKDLDLNTPPGKPNDLSITMFGLLMVLVKESLIQVNSRKVPSETAIEHLSFINKVLRLVLMSISKNNDFSHLLGKEAACYDVFQVLIPTFRNCSTTSHSESAAGTAGFPLLKTNLASKLITHNVDLKKTIDTQEIDDAVSIIVDQLLGIICKRALDWLSGSTSKRNPVNPLSVIIEHLSSNSIAEQVTIKTRLFTVLCHVLKNKNPRLFVSRRFNSLMAYLTDMLYAGWFQHGASLLLSLILDYLSPSIQQSENTNDSTVPLLDMLNTVNRIVIFAIATDACTDDINQALELVIQNQSIIFDERNKDSTFLKALAYRLASLIEKKSQSRYVNLFNILLLEKRSFIYDEVENENIHTKIISEQDESNLKTYVSAFKLIDNTLKDSWDQLVQDETNKQVKALESDHEIHLLAVQRAEQKQNSDARNSNTSKTRLETWANKLYAKDNTVLSNLLQDLHHHKRNVQQIWTSCEQQLLRTNLFNGLIKNVEWQLDSTEGPARMRIKLDPTFIAQQAESQRSNLNTPASGTVKRVGRKDDDRDDTILDEPDQVHDNNNPKNNEEEEEGVEEDQHRKIIKSLEPGDVIRGVWNINRVVGLSATAGLLLLGERNIYICDGFFQSKTGQVMEASMAPEEERDMHISVIDELAKSSTGNDDTVHRVNEDSLLKFRWPYSDLKEVLIRRYLFRDVALELFFDDGQSFILTFKSEERDAAFSHLLSKSHRAATAAGIDLPELGGLVPTFGSKLSDVVRKRETLLHSLTRKWQTREISNFEYLMICNTFASRTYNDITSYPVMPWILADYESDYLDLSNPTSFRDLSKPMGAQTAERCHDFMDRYMQLKELGEKPAHYLTHFSSAMIVVSYLVRLRPFNEAFLEVQGGTYDHADRMFSSIFAAWDSASKTGRSDVRELIPEFFVLPEFLMNHENFDFGLRQDGSNIANVELPPWAGGNTRNFIELHSRALESDYVSNNLHHWIDLIFGCLQKSVENVNVFQSLSYEGAINLDTCQNKAERKSAAAAIHSFGQTPHQLFNKPHLKRNPNNKKPWELDSNGKLKDSQICLLNQSAFLIQDFGQEIRGIHPNKNPTKAIAIGPQSVLLPIDMQTRLDWGYLDASAALYDNSNHRLSTLENVSSGLISSVLPINENEILVGNTDGTINIFKWKWHKLKAKKCNLELVTNMRGHEGPISCLASSRSFSIAVSGSQDKSSIIWNLNKQCLVKKLKESSLPIKSVTISESSGDIATCDDNFVRLYSINGELLVEQSIGISVGRITSCAFMDATPQPLLATGHPNGLVCVFQRQFNTDKNKAWTLKLIRELQHVYIVDSRPKTDITTISSLDGSIFTGDSLGRMSYWSLPESSLHVDAAVVRQCMGCNTKFGYVEFRKRCSGCSGIFCGREGCITSLTEKGIPGRFCKRCAKTFEHLP